MLTLSVLTSFTHARVFLIKLEYFYERFFDFLFFFGFYRICPRRRLPYRLTRTHAMSCDSRPGILPACFCHFSDTREWFTGYFSSSYFHIQFRIFLFFHIEIPIFFVKISFLSQYSPFLEPNLGSFFMVRSADAN